MAGNTLIAIAHRAGERPVAIEHTRPHPVLGLLGVLAALVLGHGGKDVLLQLAVGIFAKLDTGRFQHTACKADGGAQFDVCFHAPCQARNIINQHRRCGVTVLSEKAQHGFHAGAINQAA
nr:hypothetical protein [Achromobacter xylosoxidans]